MINDMEEQV